ADLNFTPFVVGLPLTNGINLAQFTAIFNINKIDLKWVTNSENDIQGFFVQRSDSQDGPFTRISQMIDAIGNNQTGGTYNYSDSSVTPSETYYYKIEVIDNLGDTIESHGPISIFAVTPTPTQTITGTITITNTPTITRTSFPTRTATQYFFRTRTRAPAFVTSTPRGGPTQVRTYGPTPTGSQTIFPNQSTTPGPELEANIDPNTGYPITGSTPQVAELLSEPPNEEGSYPITTPNPQEEVLTEAGSPQDQNTQSNTPLGSNLSEEGETGITSGLQWHFILIGAAAGLVLLLIVSLLLARVRFL
ncbi:MAG: hypothetical protein ACK2TV_02555, partial [Anaerolineales bacterium]